MYRKSLAQKAAKQQWLHISHVAQVNCNICHVLHMSQVTGHRSQALKYQLFPSQALV